MGVDDLKPSGTKPGPAPLLFFDAHCHLDFMSNADEVSADAASHGLHILATTVTPRGFESTLQTLSSHPNVHVALGAHPWWLADGRISEVDLQRYLDLVPSTRWLGEVGMDFSPKHVPEGSATIQEEAFRVICTAAASTAVPAQVPASSDSPTSSGSQTSADSSTSSDSPTPSDPVPSPRVLSIHSVRSAAACLDILEETSCIDRCRCVFHWFSGNSDELHRAVQDGCWFSVNEMMLRTRRGREYARQIPLDHLLTETDFPPGENVPFSASQIANSLQKTIAQVAESRHLSPDELQQHLAQNAQALLQ